VGIFLLRRSATCAAYSCNSLFPGSTLKANFELLCKGILQELNNGAMQEFFGQGKNDYTPKYIHVHSILSSHQAELRFSGVKHASAVG
jgi:hypothetical protein